MDRIYSLHSQGKLTFELSKDSNGRLIIDKEVIEKYDQLVKDCTPDLSEMACECGLMSNTRCSDPYTLTDDMVHCNTCDGRFILDVVDCLKRWRMLTGSSVRSATITHMDITAITMNVALLTIVKLFIVIFLMRLVHADGRPNTLGL